MMSSAVDPFRLQRARRRLLLALFAAMAIALHAMEFLLPSPTPWFRLGMANIVALLALFLIDGRAAWSVNLTRIVVGSIILGSFLSPRFLLSLAGGVLATAVMTGSRQLAGPRIGPVGVSVLGAVGHTLGQFFCAWLVLIRHESLWTLLPLMTLFSILAGLLNGLVASYLIDSLREHQVFSVANAPTAKN